MIEDGRDYIVYINYSLLNLKETSNGLFFEPYEIKLIQLNL